MNPLVLSMIMSTLIISTIIVMTSSHWLTIWMGFEMNMLTMAPLLMKDHHPRSTEATTKYFFTQATASMMLLLAVTINLLYSGQWTAMKMSNYTASTILTLAMGMKLGLSPFHFWVPEVTQGVPMTTGMILLTWQKLAPLSVLYNMMPNTNPNLLTTMSILSIVVGGWGGLNQTQLRKIMAYSSISHLGWMTTILTYNPTLTTLNLLIYIMMTITLFTLFTHTMTTTTLALSQAWNKNPAITITLLITMLSLGGLPPLTGFAPKWMIVQELTKNNNIVLPMLMTMASLLNLYFYTRLTYATSLTLLPTMNNTKTKWHHETTKNPTLLPPMIIMSTMMLPLTPSLAMIF
uniref:NADH-ubiquinone oxidoreductase chain 2 n=1 Tax=Diphylla ecaudata TaxID=148089 RepID=A0A3G1FHY0_DIPEC|nr:NADH dehydrogenase subunit 2 [Diphylla ecaudata]AOS49744.1 NADH dehydrogenase subunit 2 [Diphylla ecaudata]